MSSEAASIWFEPPNSDGQLAVLVKGPTPVLKAMEAGCSFSLYLGWCKPNKQVFLCVGLKVVDSTEAPIVFSGVQRNEEEHRGLEQLISAKSATIFLFNEMDICVAWGELSISDSDAGKAHRFVDGLGSAYVGPFTPEASGALDDFCVAVDPTAKELVEGRVKLLEIPLRGANWKASTIHFVGLGESHSFTLTEPDQGKTLEGMTWSALESLFSGNLYKNPKWEDHGELRELTDVLAFYQYGYFLFETKDLTVLPSGPGRSHDRKLKGIQKQAKKGLDQLVGAAKAVGRGEPIFSMTGAKLDFDRKQPPHCVVVLSELPNFGDWKSVEQKMMSAWLDIKAFIHVIDFHELMFLIKVCKGKPELLDHNLLERAKLFSKIGSIHIRSSAPHLPLPP